jgi:hypothetical protein
MRVPAPRPVGAIADTSIPRGAWSAAVVLLSVALLGPLLIADVPPLLDYPNHLARFVLLAFGPEDPVLGSMATPHWAIIPNLAADVIGPMLLRVLPVHFAGRCMLGGILLLNLAGVLTLHRALFGRRSFWPLGAGLVSYNSTFLLGFLNWQISSGLAMLFAAAWLGWRERRPTATIVGAAAASVVLFFCHLMGLVFFLVLIGSAEVHAMRNCRTALVRSALLLPVLLGPLHLWLLTALRAERAAGDWMDRPAKLVQVVSPFINYYFALDVMTAAFVYGGVAVGVAAGWLVLAPRAIPAVAALAMLYVGLPFDLMGVSFVDTRIVIMLGFLLFAAVDPVWTRSASTEPAANRLPSLPSSPRKRGPGCSLGARFRGDDDERRRLAILAWIDPARVGRVTAAGLAALFAVRMAMVADVWFEHRRDLADLRTVIAAVPPGASVYMTDVPWEEAQAYWEAGPRSRLLSNILRTDFHLPALLLIERGAFWPGLFASPAQQPIRWRPYYDRLVREAYDIPSHAALVADPNSVPAALRDFDFVVMLEAGADPDPAGFVPQCLFLVSQTDFAALYRVRREAAACGTDP